MLDRRGDDLVAAGLGFQRGQQGGVIQLRSASGIDDLMVEFGAQQRLQLSAVSQGGADFGAEGVH